MNKEIERDLLSLLPSISLPLPRELVDVARSLLSQSRNKASSLRQDEEIARGYVCSNIACDRLKTKLNLPTIVVRPPVAPRVYKKVYAYLDSALSAGTPRKRERVDVTSGSEPTTPSRQRPQSTNGAPQRTPTKTPQTRTPAVAQSSGKRKLADLDGDAEVPMWVMPAIRALCKAIKIPNGSPHVYTGVSSILKVIREQKSLATSTPSKKRTKRTSQPDALSKVVSDFDENYIPALLVVVAFFARSHLLGAPQAEEEYVKQRLKATQVVTKSIPDNMREDEEVMITRIEALLREAENGWLDMEWYHNLPEPDAEEDPDAEDVDGESIDNNEDRERPVRSLELPKRGFGSMMTNATDWLSDERVADYKRWEAGIMKRITHLEKHNKVQEVEA